MSDPGIVVISNATGPRGPSGIPSDELTALERLLQQDVTVPYVHVVMGQSNAVGNGPTSDAPGTGQLFIQPNIYVWDDIQSLVVPAVYGVYPLNHQVNGQYCPNPGIADMNALRASGRIPSDRQIIVFIIAVGGLSISNFIALKQNTATPPYTQGQFMLTALKTALTAANVAQLDSIQWIQGEADSISHTSDVVNVNGTFANNGFGNNADGTFANDAYFTSAVSSAVVAAGGFNTFLGYQAAFNALLAALRAQSQIGPSCPIIATELHTYWQTGELTRNDFFSTVSNGYDPFLAVVSSAGLTGSLIPGNGNHWDAASINALGPRTLDKYLQMMVGGSAGPLVDANGRAIASRCQLTINNNTDQNGVSNSYDGLSYSLSVGQLSSGASVKSDGSKIILPLASYIIGVVDLDVNVWSLSLGSTFLLSPQPLNGLPQQPTNVTINGTAYLQYEFPVTGWWRFTNGGSRWNFSSTPSLPVIKRGTDIGTTNIGANPYVLYLSGALITGNSIATTYTLDGNTNTVTTAFITDSDTTLIAHAAALAASFNGIVAGWACYEILSENAISISGPSGHGLTSVSISVTGGTSQATGTWLSNVYALPVWQASNFAYGCVAGVTYILPSSNASYSTSPNGALVELCANGGGGTAGDIYVDTWFGDQLRSRFGLLSIGGSGNLKNLTIQSGRNASFQPTLANRWNIETGSYLTSPYLQQGGTLGANNPTQVLLSAALITGNTLTINGVADATPFTAVVQLFSLTNDVILAKAALALQAALNAVVAGYVCYAVIGQNVIQILPPSGHTCTINTGTSAVTGGASQATITAPANTLNLTPAQCYGFGYILTAGVTYVIPSANPGNGQYLFALMSPSSGTPPIINSVSASQLTDKYGNTVSTITLRLNLEVVFANATVNRWHPIGGTYLSVTGSTTVAGLPSASSAKAGARDFVTDALTPAFGSPVTGGGAVGTPVISNGTVWNVG